jgi:hypothetical protein
MTERQEYLDCNTGQYHQVVAISEDMLNEQLKSYYEMLDEFKTMKVNHAIAGKIDAKLGPPKVSIPVEGNNFNEVRYHLYIPEATLRYRPEDMDTMTGDDEDFEDAELKDWEIVFSVNMCKCCFLNSRMVFLC